MDPIMREIGVGIVGGGYMGKAHAVAMAAVGAVFDTALRPRLEMVSAGSPESAERYRAAYGFARAASDWQELVADPKVEAIVSGSLRGRSASCGGRPAWTATVAGWGVSLMATD